jgi:hypothetical protein
MRGVWWNRRPSSDRLEELSYRRLLTAYRAVDLEHGDSPDAAERAALADRIAAESCGGTPRTRASGSTAPCWPSGGRTGRLAHEYGMRALELVPEDEREEEPAAWNLGIAATARRDWATARIAWRAYGVPIGGSGAEPVAEDMGPVPVRLNPPPRFVGRREVEVDGRSWDAEVVWGTRLDPARIQLTTGDGDGERTIGVSGTPPEAEEVLTAWRSGRPGRDVGELTVELE